MLRGPPRVAVRVLPVPTPSPLRARVVCDRLDQPSYPGRERGAAHPRYDTVRTRRRDYVTRRFGGRQMVRFVPSAAGDLRGAADSTGTSLKQDGAKP